MSEVNWEEYERELLASIEEDEEVMTPPRSTPPDRSPFPFEDEPEPEPVAVPIITEEPEEDEGLVVPEVGECSPARPGCLTRIGNWIADLPFGTKVAGAIAVVYAGYYSQLLYQAWRA